MQVTYNPATASLRKKTARKLRSHIGEVSPQLPARLRPCGQKTVFGSADEALSFRTAANLQLARSSCVFNIFSAPTAGSSTRKNWDGADPNTQSNNSPRVILRFDALSLRVVWCCVLVRTRNAWKSGALVVGPTVLVGHRLKARCGRFFRRCDCAAPLLEVTRSTGDAAACHAVVWGGRTG